MIIILINAKTNPKWAFMHSLNVTTFDAMKCNSLYDEAHWAVSGEMDVELLLMLQSTVPDVSITAEVVEGSTELTEDFKGIYNFTTAGFGGFSCYFSSHKTPQERHATEY